MSERFKKYHEKTATGIARPGTVRACEQLSQTFELAGLRALDFGSGAGNETRYMLERGMHVTAVDQEVGALTGLYDPKLTVVQSSFEEFVPSGEFQLITCQYSLFFVKQEQLEAVLAKLLSALAPGGVLYCDLLGENDEWADSPRISHVSREDIDRIFASLTVSDVREIEEDRIITTGAKKHWHIFEVLASRSIGGN